MHEYDANVQVWNYSLPQLNAPSTRITCFAGGTYIIPSRKSLAWRVVAGRLAADLPAIIARHSRVTGASAPLPVGLAGFVTALRTRHLRALGAADCHTLARPITRRPAPTGATGTATPIAAAVLAGTIRRAGDFAHQGGAIEFLTRGARRP